MDGFRPSHIIMSMIAFSACLLTPGGTTGAAVARPGGAARFALSKDITALNPFVLTRSIDHNFRTLIYETLLMQDLESNLRPALAKSWEISEDGLTYAFALREKAAFHNGKELAADDVKWSVEYALNPKNRAYGRDKLTSIRSVEARGPGTAVFHLKEPYAPLLAAMASIQTFTVVPKGALEVGEKPSVMPPGTGPFQFVEWKPAEQVTVKKFRNYWQKGIPYLDEVNFRVVVDETARLTALRSGQVDIAERLPYAQVERVKKGLIREVNLVFAWGAGFSAIRFNTQRPPFNDARIRQAVAFAADKDEMIRATMWGIAVPTNQKIVRGSRWFYEDVPDRKRDISRAKALLAEAGYPHGLKVPILTRQGAEGETAVLQKQLKEAGIELQIEVVDFATHTARQKIGDYYITMGGGTGSAPDPDLVYYDFHSEEGPERGNNNSGFQNKRLDQLLEEGRRVGDFEKRHKIYREVVLLLQDQVPEIFVMLNPYVFGLRPNLKGFQPSSDGQFSFGLGGLPFTWLEQ